MLLEGQPAQDSTDKRTEELGNDVDGNIRAGDKNSSSLICRNTVESLAGVKEVGDNLCDGDCGVQVSAGTESDINTCEYCKSPSEVDHEPTATLALGLGEQIRGNDAATKEKKYRSSKELRPEDLCRCHRLGELLRAYFPNFLRRVFATGPSAGFHRHASTTRPPSFEDALWITFSISFVALHPKWMNVCSCIWVNLWTRTSFGGHFAYRQIGD